MPDRLLELEHDTYRTGQAFHGALKDYYATLNRHGAPEEISQLVQQCREAGTKYGDSLEKLLEHLLAITQTDQRDKINRTVKLIKLLRAELGYLPA